MSRRHPDRRFIALFERWLNRVEQQFLDWAARSHRRYGGTTRSLL
jgi:hypothetical protein